MVELAVPTAVKAMSHHPPRAGFQGRGAVGHGELVFGWIAAGVAYLRKDGGSHQHTHPVNVTQAGSGLVDHCFDLCGELFDPGVELSQPSDALFSDPTVEGGVSPEQFHGLVKGFRVVSRGMIWWYPGRSFPRSAWSRLA